MATTIDKLEKISFTEAIHNMHKFVLCTPLWVDCWQYFHKIYRFMIILR